MTSSHLDLPFRKLNLIFYPFTHSFIYSFIHSFIHSFIYLFIHLFIYLFIYLFMYLFIHLFISIFFFLTSIFVLLLFAEIKSLQKKNYLIFSFQNLTFFCMSMFQVYCNRAVVQITIEIKLEELKLIQQNNSRCLISVPCLQFRYLSYDFLSSDMFTLQALCHFM